MMTTLRQDLSNREMLDILMNEIIDVRNELKEEIRINRDGILQNREAIEQNHEAINGNKADIAGLKTEVIQIRHDISIRDGNFIKQQAEQDKKIAALQR